MGGGVPSNLTRPGQTLTWDAENRLASVTQGGVTTAFTYNGDGQRVKVTVGNVITAYVGNLYEVNPTSGVTTTYYYFGSARVAMRTASGVIWLAGDHLGSASLAMGASNTSQRYYPYGGTRSGGVPTDYQFTGQKNDGGTGLYYYGARYYDPVTGRFVSADPVALNPCNRCHLRLGHPVPSALICPLHRNGIGRRFTRGLQSVQSVPSACPSRG